jgi:hypothetical protein
LHVAARHRSGPLGRWCVISAYMSSGNASKSDSTQLALAMLSVAVALSNERFIMRVENE